MRMQSHGNGTDRMLVHLAGERTKADFSARGRRRKAGLHGVYLHITATPREPRDAALLESVSKTDSASTLG